MSLTQKIQNALDLVLSDRRHAVGGKKIITAKLTQIESSLLMVLKAQSYGLDRESALLLKSLGERLLDCLAMVRQLDTAYAIHLLDATALAAITDRVQCTFALDGTEKYATDPATRQAFLDTHNAVKAFLEAYFDLALADYRALVQAGLTVLALCSLIACVVVGTLAWVKVMSGREALHFFQEQRMQNDATFIRYDLLDDPNPACVSMYNFSPKEYNAQKKHAYRWSFGPSANITFISTKRQMVQLKLTLSNVFEGQHMAIDVNGSTAASVNDTEQEMSSDEDMPLRVTFEAHPGLNEISFKYKYWNTSGSTLSEIDKRSFAMVFTELSLEAMPFAVAK